MFAARRPLVMVFCESGTLQSLKSDQPCLVSLHFWICRLIIAKNDLGHVTQRQTSALSSTPTY